MKVTKSGTTVEEDPGILYLLEVHLEDRILIKIGVTSRAIEDRVSEILVSIFKKYREFPYCRPKRFRKVGNVYEKEATLHKHFEEYRYTPQNKFSGSTEFFDIDIDTVVDVYENLIIGLPLNESGQDESTDP